jgi:8-oxo-dGTP pyrophosphatase MutT (NUDIX family)
MFHPSAGFAALQKPTGLSTDHFTFHITRLLELGYVEKVSRGVYRLSTQGKEYANRLDTDDNTIERQPKVAVILAIEKGDGRWLFQERLKNPYFGFYGFPSGKIRWGETILETAERELLEETGLAADRRIVGIYHEIVRSHETNELLEDKVFFVVHCTVPTGTLLEEFEGGRNSWDLPDNVFGREKVFDSVQIEIDFALNKSSDLQSAIVERQTSYRREHF